MSKFLAEIIEEVEYKSKVIIEAASIEEAYNTLRLLCDEPDKRKHLHRESTLVDVYHEGLLDLEKDIPVILPFKSEDIGDT